MYLSLYLQCFDWMIRSSGSNNVQYMLKYCIRSTKIYNIYYLQITIWSVTNTWEGSHTTFSWAKEASMIAVHYYCEIMRPVSSEALAQVRCVAFHHRTWPTTAVLSPMLMSGDCVPQWAEHASWRGLTAPLATERSQLPAPDYWTVFRHTWKTLTYCTVNSGGR